MATTTVRCNAIAFTQVSSEYPNTNYNASSSVKISGTCYGLFQFDVSPLQNYLKKYVTGFKLFAHSPNNPENWGPISTDMYFLDAVFDASTITYNRCNMTIVANYGKVDSTGYIQLAGNDNYGSTIKKLYDQLSIGIAIFGTSGERTFDKYVNVPYIEFTFEEYVKSLGIRTAFQGETNILIQQSTELFILAFLELVL